MEITIDETTFDFSTWEEWQLKELRDKIDALLAAPKEPND